MYLALYILKKGKDMKLRKKQYKNEILEQIEKADLKPGLHIIEVRHDSWCALLKGNGPCTCNAEVQEPKRVPRAEEN